MSFYNRLLSISHAEGITVEMLFKECRVSSILLERLKNKEMAQLPDHELLKVTHNPRCLKYTLWLMTDKTAVRSGQISPALSPICPRAQFINRCSRLATHTEYLYSRHY